MRIGTIFGENTFAKFSIFLFLLAITGMYFFVQLTWPNIAPSSSDKNPAVVLGGFWLFAICALIPTASGIVGFIAAAFSLRKNERKPLTVIAFVLNSLLVIAGLVVIIRNLQF